MVNNYNEIEIKQDWANYFCFVGDKSAIINLNLALKQIGPIPEYKFNIWFSLEVLNPNEDGLVTQEELERIYQIEDVINNNEIKKFIKGMAANFEMYLVYNDVHIRK